ncbi:hypothetical protein ABID82_005120 [Methylobacterium sp. PvP062]|uniref:Uncharacterized protein n=1 Tax=Methylobacterium radiotolerans TaxID=31998 RepID=A0ABV2NU81_9HYPH|nr:MULTISPECIES: hypothetical protein [unclassified Methylobacterium]MBP2498434.1 hypothetical protein [Methylobacterium sp. PvP105]MBP2505613.1 hypothetical protein [Methylobacterium sp. PvP109]
MSYSVIDHGAFEIYQPTEPPDGMFVPPGTLFSRRISDGLDWYSFSRKAENWTEGTVRAILVPTPAGDMVLSAVRDEHAMFPGNGRVVEISGVDLDIVDVDGLFANKVCNLATGEFVDPPKPPVTKVSAAQAVTALFNRGLLPLVESIALNHPYPPVKIFFQRANDWEIANPYVQAIGQELGMDATQLQVLFDDAAKIV